HPADDRDEVDDRLFRRGGGLRHVDAHLSRGFGGPVTPSGLVETPKVSPAGDRPLGPSRSVPDPGRRYTAAPSMTTRPGRTDDVDSAAGPTKDSAASTPSRSSRAWPVLPPPRGPDDARGRLPTGVLRWAGQDQ